MVEWFGAPAHKWEHLRTYHIPQALPDQSAPQLGEFARPVRRRRGLYVCGDHVDQASINGAMVSGRRAAEAALQDLSQPA
jgi:predicted NAD/FAD-dependent oxidoreductase